MPIQLQHWWRFNGSLDRLPWFEWRRPVGFWYGTRMGNVTQTLKWMRWVIRDVVFFKVGNRAEIENGSCMKSNLKTRVQIGGWFTLSKGYFWKWQCEQIQVWVVVLFHSMSDQDWNNRISGTINQRSWHILGDRLIPEQPLCVDRGILRMWAPRLLAGDLRLPCVVSSDFFCFCKKSIYLPAETPVPESEFFHWKTCGFLKRLEITGWSSK